jgi:hypothetical protein
MNVSETRHRVKALARNPHSGRFETPTKVVRAQIGFAGPRVVAPRGLVDDLKLTWTDIGPPLASYGR